MSRKKTSHLLRIPIKTWAKLEVMAGHAKVTEYARGILAEKINKSPPGESNSESTVPPEELIDPSCKEEF